MHSDAGSARTFATAALAKEAITRRLKEWAWRDRTPYLSDFSECEVETDANGGTVRRIDIWAWESRCADDETWIGRCREALQGIGGVAVDVPIVLHDIPYMDE
ncbi:Hypothetical protein UVM_LOCUS425 [uncultured virus]|nr:Hypothetical protein UVM_LOCUS425 [uncultured virus]